MGHKDNVHGGYHYHCGGHSAHQHPNGVCPYSAKPNTANTQAATERGATAETVTATTIQSTVTPPSITNKVIPTVSFQSADLTITAAAVEDKTEGGNSGAVLGSLAIVAAGAGIGTFIHKKKK